MQSKTPTSLVLETHGRVVPQAPCRHLPRVRQIETSRFWFRLVAGWDQWREHQSLNHQLPECSACCTPTCTVANSYDSEAITKKSVLTHCTSAGTVQNTELNWTRHHRISVGFQFISFQKNM